MSDRFSKFPSSVDSAGRDAFPAVANNSITFDQPSRAVYVGGAGNLEVRMLGYNSANGSIVTFAGVSAGSMLPLRVDQVLENTTATNIVIIY